MEYQLPIFGYWHSADHSLLGDFLADWHVHFPDLRIIGDAEVEPLIGQISPEYAALFRRIRFPAQKSDVARLAYIHEFGGLYVDCHCGLRNAFDLRELFGKLDQYELVLWENSYITVPRPKDRMRPINGILLCRPRSSIVRHFLISGLANFDAHSRQEASEGLVECRPWHMCGAGNYSRILNVPASGDTQLKPEFAGRIFFSNIDDGPISIYRHNAYKTDPEQHWSRRKARELLFEPNNPT